MHRWLIRTGFVLLGGILVFAAAAAQSLSGLFVPQRTLDQQIDLIAPGVTVFLPERTQTPVPAAIFFHGCGGRRPMHFDHAEALQDAGFAVLVVDSFEPRGIGRLEAMTQVCTATRLTGQERAADVFAAIEIAWQTGGVDPDRLVLFGWSHGGWSLLDALSYVSDGIAPPALVAQSLSLDGVANVVPIYPYCGFPARAAGRMGSGLPPVDMILAGRDMVAPYGDCVRLAEQAVANRADFNFSVWNGLTHAFDDTDAPAIDFRMQYDAAAAERLRLRMIEILQATQD
ncbi:dienelactone hydrolase family protein [Hyphobacterium sp. HN65]|uniref:Dienelactone hydrolase family protein n=1 Tax=Hyphobacterium lacteum TaxID=3116575 RepID=A0ABU7LRL5_9PROT|nr:dienelactone hydrolase family protein [Hyphobacterium sp. HN65]MEE2526555.1 dienelactone hydrolase family protein [Hyphobacterium sp. HN65]